MEFTQQAIKTRNPLYGYGSNIPQQIPTTQINENKQAKSAIQQAVDMFNKIINLKVNRPPLPISQIKNYAVAALPGGQMLMSSGKTKISTPTKRIEEAKAKDQESVGTIATKKSLPETVSNLLFRVAMPTSQIGTNQNRAFAFANYLNQILKPQMNVTPGISTPAMLPLPQPAGGFVAPALTMKQSDSFKPVADGIFKENTDKIQKELMKRFLAQFSRGERPAAYGAMGGIGRTPIISRNTQSYTLPAPQGATTSTIESSIPSPSRSTIIY